MFGIIYMARNLLNGKVYIGQTITTLSRRIVKHRFNYKNSNTNSVFHKALRKYGEDNFVWTIIDQAESRDELNEKEIFWINHYNSHDMKLGYNMTIGMGQGTYWSGRNHTDETKNKISKANKGNYHSDETKRKMSESKLGKYDDGDNPRAKSVVQLSLDGEYIDEFNTAKEASERVGCHRQNITACCKGRLNQTGGYRWVYKDEYIEE